MYLRHGISRKGNGNFFLSFHFFSIFLSCFLKQVSDPFFQHNALIFQKFGPSHLSYEALFSLQQLMM